MNPMAVELVKAIEPTKNKLLCIVFSSQVAFNQQNGIRT